MKKNKGTTFGELMIVFLIISVALIVFLKIASDYIRSLVFAKEMFIMESLLQEKYQMLIAYRNKMLEKNFEASGLSQNPFSFTDSRYAIEFNTTTGKITLMPISADQSLKFITGATTDFKYLVNIQNNGNYVSTTISIYTPKIRQNLFSPLKLYFQGIITPWHPAFQ